MREMDQNEVSEPEGFELRVQVTLASMALQMFNEVLESGLYGASATEVARRLFSMGSGMRSAKASPVLFSKRSNQQEREGNRDDRTKDSDRGDAKGCKVAS